MNSQFDLFRLSKSKIAVDICSNTLRAYHKEGLPIYRRGKAAFVSRSDLEAFIRQKSDSKPIHLPGKKKQKLAWGFVYIMRDGKRFKIGITTNPEERLYGLQTANPDIELMGAVFCKNPEQVEAYWHDMFDEKRYDREWFNLTDEDARLVLGKTGTLQLA